MFYKTSEHKIHFSLREIICVHTYRWLILFTSIHICRYIKSTKNKNKIAVRLRCIQMKQLQTECRFAHDDSWLMNNKQLINVINCIMAYNDTYYNSIDESMSLSFSLEYNAVVWTELQVICTTLTERYMILLKLFCLMYVM